MKHWLLYYLFSFGCFVALNEATNPFLETLPFSFFYALSLVHLLVTANLIYRNGLSLMSILIAVPAFMLAQYHSLVMLLLYISWSSGDMAP